MVFALLSITRTPRLSHASGTSAEPSLTNVSSVVTSTLATRKADNSEEERAADRHVVIHLVYSLKSNPCC